MPGYIKVGLEQAFNNYNTTPLNPVDGFVNALQSTFECCGLSGKQYWRNRGFHQSLPTSCCFKIEFQNHAVPCEDNVHSGPTAWSAGCVDTLIGLAHQYISAIAGIMIFAGAIKIIAACFACSLANAVQY